MFKWLKEWDKGLDEHWVEFYSGAIIMNLIIVVLDLMGNAIGTSEVDWFYCLALAIILIIKVVWKSKKEKNKTKVCSA